jgi:hypothetical protein
VEALTADCGAIIDGVDVTTMSGLRAKFLVHQHALRQRLPVIAGWDMAGVQYVQCYDYRRITREFDGRVSPGDIESLTTWEIILKLIPMRRIPPEMLADMSPNLQNPEYSAPQLTYAALMFGAFSAHLVTKLLAGEVVRKEIVFDLHQAARVGRRALGMRARWPIEAVRMEIARRRLSRASGG